MKKNITRLYDVLPAMICCFLSCIPSGSLHAQTPFHVSLDIRHADKSQAGEVRVIAQGGISPYEYHWSHSNDTIPVLSQPGVGTYVVTVKDASGTTQTASGSVRLIDPANQFHGNAFKVYVLPSSELIMIQAAEMLTKTLQLELKDKSGSTVATKEFFQGSTICHIPTTTLYDGEYTLILFDEGESKSFPILINRE